MDFGGFNEWLIKYKGMSMRSAKDVISRCRRVLKMIEESSLSSSSIDELQERLSFCNCSIFVKSQLLRAVHLWIEYEETNE